MDAFSIIMFSAIHFDMSINMFGKNSIPLLPVSNNISINTLVMMRWTVTAEPVHGLEIVRRYLACFMSLPSKFNKSQQDLRECLCVCGWGREVGVWKGPMDILDRIN